MIPYQKKKERKKLRKASLMPHILDVVAKACNPSNWKVQGERLEIQGHLWLQIQLKANQYGGWGQAIYFPVEGLSMKIVCFCLLLSRQGLLFPGWSWSHYVAKDNLEFLTHSCLHLLKKWDYRCGPMLMCQVNVVLGLNQGLIQVEQASYWLNYIPSPNSYLFIHLFIF